ncbi:MAG TPA: YihY family inner membrane protein [Azospirillaceae bacterium]|nr:YihY family inner membrane protein [Azospirillaceae bacterium]
MTARRGWAERVRHLPRGLLDAVSVLGHALARFSRDNCFQAAGSLTYTALLAIVPMLTVTFAIFSAFPAFEEVREDAERLVIENLVPTVSDVVRSNLDRFMDNAAAMTGFGVIGLTVTTILLFFTIEGSFNAIWRASEPRPLVVRLLSFWAVLTVAPLLFGTSMSLSSSMLADFQATGQAVEWFRFILPGLAEAAALTLMYLSIPNRVVLWKDALVGGVTAAVLLELSKVGFGLYITLFPTYETIYGALSVIPIFLVWLYLVWSIALLGAELTATLPEWRSGRITQVGPEGLLSAQRIVVAIAILKELRAAARLGVGIRRATLVNRIPVGPTVIDGMLEQLRAAHWVARTTKGAWVASRDLHAATLYDLQLSLGMGLRGNLRSVGRLEAGWQDRLACLFAEVEANDARILGLTLEELFRDGEGRRGSAEEEGGPAQSSMPAATPS